MLRKVGLRVAGILSLLVFAGLLSGCLPSEPAAGRGTPVKRVLVMGDSMTFGLYGTSPQLHEPLTALLADRGVSVRIDGFPGENPIFRFPGNPSWAERMNWWISVDDPDMVVIQTILLPDSANPEVRQAYLVAMSELLDIAGSRGAHVYLVSHPVPPEAGPQVSRDAAQELQAEAASGRGVATIPLDYWLGRCEGGFLADGWHLSARGQQCHAFALTLAVDQLRDRTG